MTRKAVSGAEPGSGGRTTISPPFKVNQILLSGLDSLVLAIDVAWKNKDFFDLLDCSKKDARESGKSESVQVGGMLFDVYPHGTAGYEWLLSNKEYSMRIGNWLKPKTRPSIMLEIRSETLWTCGPCEAVNKVIRALEMENGLITIVKVSRSDLCLDMLVDEKLWNLGLSEFRVTKAFDCGIYLENAKLTGLTMGRGGQVSARIYDKFLEIRKSKKTWFYDLWQLDHEPEGMKIIRVEFQLRREGLKELGVNTFDNLMQVIDNAWAYCTKKWLKFQDGPGLHWTRRSTLPWWVAVQEGFLGCQGSHPLIRCKAIKKDKDQLFCQTYGTLSSMAALSCEEKGQEFTADVSVGRAVSEFGQIVHEKNIWDRFLKDVQKKRAKYHRSIENMKHTARLRQLYGFPTEVIPF